ncbi:MAG: ABC transporter permease [Planctomycetes bacterium]|nr:ABC transporter permease [Planctomycetota bacterium]
MHSPPSLPIEVESSPVKPPVAEAAIAPVEDDFPITVIEARHGWQIIDARELWRFREVLYYLAWRDIKVRYKQSILGVTWALLQPLAAMLVFALFLGRLGGLGGNNVEHYALFVFAGILPWTFFGNAISTAGNSVVANERLVTKVWFPRLIVPLSSIAAAVFDFLIALGLLGILMAAYGVAPSWQILFAPVIFMMLILAAVGVGTLLAALIVAHRDFRYVLTFGVQLWMFATPCIYLPPQTFGPLAQTWLPFNPVYGLILNFRQAVLGGPFDWYALGVSSIVSLALVVFGAGYFRRVERHFADII